MTPRFANEHAWYLHVASVIDEAAIAADTHLATDGDLRARLNGVQELLASRLKGSLKEGGHDRL